MITPSFTSGNALVLGGPQYLTFGTDLAVTDINGHLFRFDPVTGVATFGSALDNPVGVAFERRGSLCGAADLGQCAEVSVRRRTAFDSDSEWILCEFAAT